MGTFQRGESAFQSWMCRRAEIEAKYHEAIRNTEVGNRVFRENPWSDGYFTNDRVWRCDGCGAKQIGRDCDYCGGETTEWQGDEVRCDCGIPRPPRGRKYKEDGQPEWS